MRNKNVLFIILLIINSFLIGILFITNVNSQSAKQDIEYKFNKNTLFDSFDTLERDNINLRHNNIITNDYNGTYIFNETIGSIPIGWNDLSVGDGEVKTDNYLNGHNGILNLITISTDEAKIENIFYDGKNSYGTLELWYLTTDATKTGIIRLMDGVNQIIVFRNTADVFQIYDGVSVYTCNIIPLDNTWYHIRIDFECTLGNYKGLNQYETNLYINKYNEGKFDFYENTLEIDRLDLLNSGIFEESYTMVFDSVGYSWFSNYTINGNLYPNIEIVDSNILTLDKYEFNFDSNGNPYEYGCNDIFGWNTIEPSKLFIGVPAYTSNKSENINGVYSKGYAPTGIGIKNETLKIYQEKINITFGLEFAQIESEALNTYILFYIYSLNDTEIVRLRFDVITPTIIDLEYWNGISYQNLVRIYGIDSIFTYKFNLYLENFEVKLRWFKNDIYNNTYTFSLIKNLLGVNRIKILNFDNLDDANDLFLRLVYIGIYQYNISLTREFGSLRYNLEKEWNFNKYNLFNFNSNNSFKVLTINHYTIYPLDYYSFRNFDNKFFFYNLYDKENIIEKPHLYLITKTNINLSSYLFFSIEGIKLNKYIDNVFSNEMTIKYYFHNININHSYYYVDNSNRLHYQMSITQNDTWEYMMLYFDFARHISSNNRSIYFKCKKLSIIGKPYIAMSYWQPPDNKFYLETYLKTFNTLLSHGKEFRRFHFIANDVNNNNYTNFISEGYLYGLQFNYVPFGIIPEISFIILSLIAIIIPLIVIIVPSLAIYGVYRKREVILPLLLLFSIIAFATSLITFQVFFIIIIALGCGIFLKYKKGID